MAFNKHYFPQAQDCNRHQLDRQAGRVVNYCTMVQAGADRTGGAERPLQSKKNVLRRVGGYCVMDKEETKSYNGVVGQRWRKD